jgi:hypothetical protein
MRRREFITLLGGNARAGRFRGGAGRLSVTRYVTLTHIGRRG